MHLLDLLAAGLCPACRFQTAGVEGCCDNCRTSLFQPIAMPGLVALGYYRGGLRAAIRSYKFRGRRRLARLFGHRLARAVRDRGWDLDGVTFVPLHAGRKRERGFDQAQLLALETARQLNLPCLNTLSRARPTGRQSRLSPAARRANTSGAFEVSRTPEGTLLLIDDVFTTGATLSACSEALLAAGAASVYLAVVALAAKRSPLAAGELSAEEDRWSG